MAVTNGAPVVVADTTVTGIMVATPMFGGMCYDNFVHGMLDLQRELHDRKIRNLFWTTRNESDIKRARNRAFAEFIASGFSHLVFIDADIGFEANDVLRLVAHDRHYVGATYAKKNREKTDFAVVPLERARRLRTGLVEVAALPGGFFCLSRDMALRMYEAYRELRYQVAPAESKGEDAELFLVDVFGSIICPETRTYWSEDYAFSRRWREMGGDVFLDPWITLEHSGTSIFTGDPRTMFWPLDANGEPEPMDAAPVVTGLAPVVKLATGADKPKRRRA